MANRQHEQFQYTLVVAVNVLRKWTQLARRFAANGLTGPLCELIKCGLSVNTTVQGGCTLLHLAAACGRTQTVMELIRLGADKSKVADVLGSPLHVAALSGHHITVREMLKAGCPVDVVANKSQGVLHYAAQGGNVKVMREVLKKGCDINALDCVHMTPLHRAVEHGHTEAALYLIKHGAEKAVVADELGTPLHQAAVAGYTSMLKEMLKAGCPADVVASNGCSILHAAANCGNTEMIREVLRTKCDINATDNDGDTPLHLAAIKGHTQAALELIRHGANKAIVAGAKGTPLHQAAGFGHVSTVKAMLKAGCPVDAVASNGCSVVHAAAEYGYVEVIGLLLGKACDVNATDSEGRTPLDYAAGKGMTKAVLKLVQHGADKATVSGPSGGPLQTAALSGHWSTVEVMLDERFPVDGVVSDGETLLHLVAVGGDARLLRLLVERGLNVSRRDYFGLTPLHYAVLCRSGECVKVLLELGANAKAEAPLLGSPLNAARLYMELDMELLLGNTAPLSRRPDEMIVDFALCKELGIKMQSPYLFSEHGGTISVFESILFAERGIKNMVRTPTNLRKVLSIFSKHKLVNVNKLVCLAAIHGDVAVLECLSGLSTAHTEPGHFFYRRLKQLFTVYFRRPDKNVLLQVLPEGELNPLHLAIVSMMCAKQLYHVCIDRSSRKYTEVIRILTTNDSYCRTLNECLLNGLSPLDLAEQLGIDEAAAIIISAGGRQGVWSIIPEEVRLEHGSAVLHLHQGLKQLTSAGAPGQQAVQAMLGQLLGRTTTAEQGTATEESHLRQQKALDQRPDLSIISTYVICLVNVDRWRRLGISLKIPLEALTLISSTHSSCEDRYLEVLIYWLEHNEAASWRTLLEVLGHFEIKLIMDLLTQKICGTENCSWQSTSVRYSVPFHPYPLEVGATPPPPSSQLSPQFVSHVVHHVGVKWYNFALHLGISSTVLDVIKVEKRLISDCCRESLYRWLRLDRDTGGERREEGVVLEAVRKACGPVAVERIQTSLQRGEVTPSSSTPLLQSTPKLAVLQEHVVPFTAVQWEVVADYLRVSYEKQAVIAANERGHVEVCCRELFNQWLQELPGTGSLPRTWGKVLDVVGEAVGPEVAKQIKTRLDSKEGDPLRDELLHSKPTAVPLLKKVVPSVAHKWHQLGIHLGMEVAILKTFKVTESHDVKLCCLEMFECWLQESRGTGESPRTWSTVLSAVGDCLGHDVADNIERALLEETRQRKQ